MWAQLDSFTYHDQLKFYWSCWDIKSHLYDADLNATAHDSSMVLFIIPWILSFAKTDSLNIFKLPWTYQLDVDEKWNRQLIECELIVKQSIFRHQYRVFVCLCINLRYFYLMSIDLLLLKNTRSNSYMSHVCIIWELNRVTIYTVKKIFDTHSHRSGYYICYIVVWVDFVRVYG